MLHNVMPGTSASAIDLAGIEVIVHREGHVSGGRAISAVVRCVERELALSQLRKWLSTSPDNEGRGRAPE